MRYADIVDSCIMVPWYLDYNEQQRFILEHQNYTLIYDLGEGFLKHNYYVLHNGADLQPEDIARFCAKDQLNFGYRANDKRITIHTGGYHETSST
jgi:hypothetical protein